ncbi:hypothetical protein M8C21_033036 [Ambrosia artemisiifolia]|uniref:Cytochrome P450 n=1 Tax=Ambrosia artemisiifolia TaxID=4212 RepID=A0AAD5CG65_AMBAR|nr:hypothetical protein M8C21_033036 [Ambrosia artemisiifolia]
MEFPLSFSTTITSIFVGLVIAFLLQTLRTKRLNIVKNQATPQAKGSWPIIGHLHLLSGSRPPQQVLGDMADIYGPIFTIKLGVHQVLVVSSGEVAKECLTTNDKVFASRPKSKAEIMAYNYAMFGLAPYGEYWRQVRKIVMLEILSQRRVEMLGHVRVSEVRASMEGIYEAWLMNKESKGYEKEMKITGKEMDHIIEGWLKNRKREKENGQQQEGDQFFMDVLISVLQDASEEDFVGYDHDTVIKATCLAMITAGSDTTSTTLTWALSLLLNNPNTLKTAQDEIGEVVGRERLVEESDIKNLVYLDAIIKETLRLYPAAPLSVPHESMEDCVVSGYNIPKGTRLLVNLWKIHRDPNIWPDPYEFKPERFLTSQKDIDLKGNHFELVPFGSGRRMCPGVFFALQVLPLALANVIQQFVINKPSNEPIDMSESSGLTVSKATPLEVLIAPRLSDKMYHVGA